MRRVRRHNSTRRSISSRHPGRKEQHRTEVSAGGIVIKRTKNGIAVAMIKDSYGHWTFPKGHLEPGETTRQAAIREVEEEMGLRNLLPMAKLGTIDIWFRDQFVFKGKLVRKYIHYFLFEAIGDTTLRMQVQSAKEREKIRDVVWVPIQQMRKKSSYQDMIPIVERAMMILERKNFA